MKCLGILNYQGLLPKVFLPFSFYRGLVSMIRYLLLQNRQGKTRLSKWYMPVEFEEQARLENEIHKLVSARDNKVTNFIEFSTYKLITRRYAGLYFTVAVDSEDNELLTLETIHFLVMRPWICISRVFVKWISFSISTRCTRLWTTILLLERCWM